MKTLLRFALAPTLVLLAADKAQPPEPTYNVATVINFTAKVTEVRDVSRDNPLAGLHLTVQFESQALDVYVGPSEFVKVFDVTFVKGDSIQVIGSKVDFEGSAVVLAREVALGPVTLVCRDKDGSPLWKYFIKPPQG
jgi:hypothetical protein